LVHTPCRRRHRRRREIGFGLPRIGPEIPGRSSANAGRADAATAPARSDDADRLAEERALAIRARGESMAFFSTPGSSGCIPASQTARRSIAAAFPATRASRPEGTLLDLVEEGNPLKLVTSSSARPARASRAHGDLSEKLSLAKRADDCDDVMSIGFPR